MYNMKKKATILLLFGFQVMLSQSKLEGYINNGLQNNETIKQQVFQLEKNLYALKEAKALFMPSVSFNSTYTLADGGRTIDFPVGDLLNPVYSSLNQLTNSTAFSQLQNQSILLNPNRFFDAKIHTTLPIFNAEIIYNKRIKQQEFDLQKIEIDIYKRELVKEIKLAYFNYSKANEAIAILENALKLVKENQRINTSLFNNDRINRTAVIRSDNEVTKVNAQLETAKLQKNNAKNYFNFIINSPLDNEIELDKNSEIPIEEIKNSSTNREELKKLQGAKEINSNVIKLTNAFQIPKLDGFIDLGTQTFDFDFTDKSRYYLAGLSLEWSLFSGNKNRFKVKQARLENDMIDSQINYVEQQLNLQLQMAQNKSTTAILQHNAAQSQVNTSQKYYADVLKAYKEGQALFIELLDAQNQLITAQLQANITRYDTWIAYAEIERANASFNLK
jgi:outer membrane protein TolC